MFFSKRIFWCLILLQATVAQATITVTGNIDPEDPSDLGSSTMVCIGRTSDGTLTVDDASELSTKWTFLGYDRGVSGTATVSGNDSTWTIMGLYNGYKGAGQLNILDGGTVNVSRGTWLGYGGDCIGAIHFDSGTLNTDGLCAGKSDLTGNGTIYTDGLVSDVDLLFDAQHGSQKTFVFDQLPGQNITIHLEQKYSYIFGAGCRDKGTLTIKDGVSVDCRTGCLGYHAGSTGMATVSGSGSCWDNYSLSVGCHGTGVLDIVRGGNVECTFSRVGQYPGSMGIVNVTGGSTWDVGHGFWVGAEGTGILNVTNGGVVSGIMEDIRLGDELNAMGVITVSGDGSECSTVSNLYVGMQGTGLLNIANQGVVHVSKQTWVGYRSDATGTIHLDSGTLNTNGLCAGVSDLTGEGTINTHGLISDIDLRFDAEHGVCSTFTLSDLPEQNVTINLEQNSDGILGAGYRSVGSLTIQDGVTAESCYGYLGYHSGSKGVATVSGDGSTWSNERTLYVGYEGSGTLNIVDGAVVSNPGGHLGDQAGSKGVITVSGENSLWTNERDIYIGNFGSGTLNITNGGTVVDNCSSIGYEAGAIGNVTVSGQNSKWTNRYNFGLGYEGAGQLNITDGGLVSGWGVTIDYKATGNSFINMSTGGMLALKGEVDDSIVDFLTLVEGTDAIRWWNNAIGDWDLLTSATMGTDYTLEYLTDGDLTGYTVLTVLSGWLPGDANRDGRVDGSDVTILANNWQAGVDDGQTVTWEMGDFNSDGRVDGSDVTILANNWQYGVTTTTAAVPEPSTLVLILSAVFATGIGLRRRKWGV